MLIVLDGTDLITGLITEVSINRTVFGDPCLGQYGRPETRDHGNMPATTRGLLGQNDVADLESAVGLITGPLFGNVGEVPSQTLLTERTGPGRPGEIAGGEGLSPLVVSCEVVTARNESRAVRIGWGLNKPTVPIGLIVESPAVRLGVTDIRDVGVIPSAGRRVLRYSHFDLFSRLSSR